MYKTISNIYKYYLMLVRNPSKLFLLKTKERVHNDVSYKTLGGPRYYVINRWPSKAEVARRVYWFQTGRNPGFFFLCQTIVSVSFTKERWTQTLSGILLNYYYYLF